MTVMVVNGYEDWILCSAISRSLVMCTVGISHLPLGHMWSCRRYITPHFCVNLRYNMQCLPHGLVTGAWAIVSLLRS